MDEPTTALDRWLAAAIADADRRGLPELRPLLQGLATSTAALRMADWNDHAGDAARPKAEPAAALNAEPAEEPKAEPAAQPTAVPAAERPGPS